MNFNLLGHLSKANGNIPILHVRKLEALGSKITVQGHTVCDGTLQSHLSLESMKVPSSSTNRPLQVHRMLSALSARLTPYPLSH